MMVTLTAAEDGHGQLRRAAVLRCTHFVIFVVAVWWWFGDIKLKLEGPEFGEVKETWGKEV
jgi:hypothetical protein